MIRLFLKLINRIKDWYTEEEYLHHERAGIKGE
jgi:hypothetical protein